MSGGSGDQQDKQNQQGQQQNQQNQQQRGQQNQQKGGQKKKSRFAQTNVAGYILWGASAVLTSLALNKFADLAGAYDSITDSTTYAGAIVVVVGVVLQFLLTTAERNMRDHNIRNLLTGADYVLNSVGIYYLFCEVFGMFGTIKVIVDYAVRETVVSTVVGCIVIAALSIWSVRAQNAFFDAP